jgi:hypothetical protein
MKTEQIIYQGNLKNYQIFKNTNPISYEKDIFNEKQNFFYKRALYGLKSYAPEEWEKIPGVKKKRIIKVNKRAQEILNIWKQELVNEKYNSLLKSVFFHSKLINDFISEFGKETDPEYICTVSFKELNLTKKDIAQKLVSEKVLPVNFFELK